MHKLLLLLLIMLTLRTAKATYSIVATDAKSGQVGGSGTSCVGSLDVAVILGAAPGIGAIHAQAQLNEAGRDRGVELLKEYKTPSDIIAEITSSDFDFNFLINARQYAVVDLLGRASAFTGANNGKHASDVQGRKLNYTYSIQGNILTSRAVINQSEVAFVQDGLACDDLPERLMLALEAGGLNGEGDSRCTTTRGIPADSAFIKVYHKTGEVLLSLSVSGTKGSSAIPPLREMFDAWRSKAGCIRDANSTFTTTEAPTTLSQPPPLSTTPSLDAVSTPAGLALAHIALVIFAL